MLLTLVLGMCQTPDAVPQGDNPPKSLRYVVAKVSGKSFCLLLQLEHVCNKSFTGACV